MKVCQVTFHFRIPAVKEGEDITLAVRKLSDFGNCGYFLEALSLAACNAAVKRTPKKFKRWL